MKKNYRILALFLFFTFIFSFASCGGSNEREPNIVLQDQVGRTVILEKPAEKIVSCYYISTYAMLSLGAGNKLVGIEKKADTRPIYKMAYPEMLSLPAVGSLKEINVEAIASLSPDLVILPKKLQESAAVLEAIGIVTLIVNPETDAEMRDMLLLIGASCGASEKAVSLLTYYDEKISDFQPPFTPTVLCCGNSSYLSVAPSKMYQNDFITLGGGTNAFAESEENYWQEISYETWLRLNPDYILIPAGASYSASDIANDPMLSELNAVKDGTIITVPNTFEEWDSPIPSGVLGVLWLRSVLHPDTYGEASLRKDVTEFYETFYGFTPSNEALDTLK